MLHSSLVRTGTGKADLGAPGGVQPRPLPSTGCRTLGFTSGLGGLIQPRDALVISRHGKEKQSNTLNESNTIRTLVSILCPQMLWALEQIAVSGQPRGWSPRCLTHCSSPLPSMQSLRGWSSQVWQAGGFQSLRLQPPHPGSGPP